MEPTSPTDRTPFPFSMSCAQLPLQLSQEGLFAEICRTRKASKASLASSSFHQGTCDVQVRQSHRCQLHRSSGLDSEVEVNLGDGRQFVGGVQNPGCEANNTLHTELFQGLGTTLQDEALYDARQDRESTVRRIDTLTLRCSRSKTGFAAVR